MNSIIIKSRKGPLHLVNSILVEVNIGASPWPQSAPVYLKEKKHSFAFHSVPEVARMQLCTDANARVF